jgi:hypothetical protein
MSFLLHAPSGCQTYRPALKGADDTESEEEKGGASERTPAARELGTGEHGTARVLLAADTSRQPKSTVNGMTVVNSRSAGGDSAVGSRQGHQDSRYNF